jgi:hypothetical protein
MGSWALAGVMGAVLGCCCINPDGGDYNVWVPQVRAVCCVLLHAVAAAAERSSHVWCLVCLRQQHRAPAAATRTAPHP